MADITLVTNNIAASIELPANPSPAEKHAAAELQSHIKQITGVEPRVLGANETDARAILVGRSPRADELLQGFDWKSLKEDGVVVRSAKGQLVLAGATPRGTIYAVNEFLESLGVRWLSPTASVIPKKSRLELDAVDIVHTPVFRYREPFFTNYWNSPDYAARQRANGSFIPLTEKHGGKFGYAGFVHTFYNLVPPAEHFAAHPEYFSEINGERVGENGQLCLTNDNVIAIATATARKWLREQPGARIVSVSQNDWVGNCTCKSCRAVDAEEGGPSGSLVRFVNAVAANLESEFPHVLVDTLAYMYTIDPPKLTQPRANVVIRLCHLNSPCDSHPLEGCPMNTLYLDQLKRWTAVAPEVFIWDYFNNFANYFMPYPNLDAIGADLPLYASSGVTGVFCQGDGTPAKGPGDMAELRAYLIAKLLWRPASNARAIIEEFMQLYYGAAAEPLKEWLEILHRPARQGAVHIHPYLPVTLGRDYLDEETLRRADSLFNVAAARVKGDEALEKRVEAARLPVEFTRIGRGLRYGVREGRFKPSDDKLLARARRFFEIAVANGAKGLREQAGRPIEDDRAALDGFEVIALEHAGLRVDIVPAMGGRMIGLTDSREPAAPRSSTGPAPSTAASPGDALHHGPQNWMHVGQPGESGFPVTGGYEEYSEVRWRSPGWKESYTATRVGEASLQLRAELADGLVMSRIYSIDSVGGNPRLTIESSLRNSGTKERMVLLRMHPEVSAGDWKAAAVRVWKKDGSREDWSPWNAGAEAEGSRWLEGDAVPAGKWGLVRGAKQLVVAFGPGAILKALPSWDRALNSVRLDMYAHPRKLKAGEATKVKQVWSIEQA